MLLSMSRFVFAIALAITVLFSPILSAHAAPLEPMHLAALPLIGNRFAGQRPTTLGVKDGQLAPCPTSPNCVVSQGNTDAEHAIAPLTYSGDPANALERLATLIKGLPRTTVVEQTENYLYAEFTSQWMGYVDDVEFYLDPVAEVIQVRSASRLGQSDLGVNRQRIEAIRTALTA
jgi:uncharacterized protein (DUF1499 family)